MRFLKHIGDSGELRVIVSLERLIGGARSTPSASHQANLDDIVLRRMEQRGKPRRPASKKLLRFSASMGTVSQTEEGARSQEPGARRKS